MSQALSVPHEFRALHIADQVIADSSNFIGMLNHGCSLFGCGLIHVHAHQHQLTGLLVHQESNHTLTPYLKIMVKPSRFRWNTCFKVMDLTYTVFVTIALKILAFMLLLYVWIRIGCKNRGW